MSQQQQVMLQGDHRRRWIFIGILLIVLSASLLEAWKPGTLRSIASLLLGYTRSMMRILGDLTQTIRNW